MGENLDKNGTKGVPRWLSVTAVAWVQSLAPGTYECCGCGQTKKGMKDRREPLWEVPVPIFCPGSTALPTCYSRLLPFIILSTQAPESRFDFLKSSELLPTSCWCPRSGHCSSARLLHGTPPYPLSHLTPAIPLPSARSSPLLEALRRRSRLSLAHLASPFLTEGPPRAWRVPIPVPCPPLD